MDTLQAAKKLTIEEYIVLREVISVGDVRNDSYSHRTYQSLISKGLMAESTVSAGYFYPTEDARQVLTSARFILGILSI